MTDPYVVTLQLPPTTHSVRPARAVAASLGVDCGMDLDELDDLRVAVQEAFALVLGTADGNVEMQVSADGPVVRIELSAASTAAAAEPSSLARQLLDVLVASHSIESTGDRLVISLASHPALAATDAA